MTTAQHTEGDLRDAEGDLAPHTEGDLTDAARDLAREELEHLDQLLDEHSVKALTATGIRHGLRCLEVGAGSGSIARWMADRVRPDGRVVAIDLDTDRFDVGTATIDVRRHDINHGAPGGPFDLIHARLVLMHLPCRRQILHCLYQALAPGGWLVLGEHIAPSLGVLNGPTEADCELFDRVMHTMTERVARPGGTDFGWALDVDSEMRHTGLVHLHSERHMATTAGGTTGCLLFQNYVRRAAPHLLQHGIGQDQLDRFDQLMRDPRFRAWFFEFTSVRGQKPFA